MPAISLQCPGNTGAVHCSVWGFWMNGLVRSQVLLCPLSYGRKG